MAPFALCWTIIIASAADKKRLVTTPIGRVNPGHIACDSYLLVV